MPLLKRAADIYDCADIVVTMCRTETITGQTIVISSRRRLQRKHVRRHSRGRDQTVAFDSKRANRCRDLYYASNMGDVLLPLYPFCPIWAFIGSRLRSRVATIGNTPPVSLVRTTGTNAAFGVRDARTSTQSM